jgi:Glycine-rich domain-containing protein-like
MVAEHARHYPSTLHALIPPPDIAWLWHCHRLSPYEYEKYCIKYMGGKVVDASPPFTYMIESCNGNYRGGGSGGGGNTSATSRTNNKRDQVECAHTLKVWSNMYTSESFFCHTTENDTAEQESVCVVLNDGFDIARSACSQRQFLYQVSHPCYGDNRFLKEGVAKYHKFLKLKIKDDSMIVPTLQIDLAWHAHMLVSSSDYSADCTKIRGAMLNHDDTFDDRSPGSRQQQAYHETIKLWEQQYIEPYVAPYGNYLGDPPAEFYHPLWVSTVQNHPTNATQVYSTNTELYPKDDNVEVATKFADTLWVDPSVNPIHNGQPVFVDQFYAAQGESIYPNLRIEDFVFGNGCAGKGYYSLQTRDAHLILLCELQISLVQETNKRNDLLGNGCLCFGSKQSPANTAKVRNLDASIENIETTIKHINVRVNSSGPNADLTDCSDSLNQMDDELIKLHSPAQGSKGFRIFGR